MTDPIVNIDELERLALAAGGKQWQINDHYIEDVDRGYVVDCADANMDFDKADFIAAANPAAILALIKMVRENVIRAIVDSVFHPDAEMCEREAAICLSQKQARIAHDWFSYVAGSGYKMGQEERDLAFSLDLAAQGEEPEATR